LFQTSFFGTISGVIVFMALAYIILNFAKGGN
jgi:hypothetical protein